MTPSRKRYLTPPESPRTVGFWRRKITASGRTRYSPNVSRTLSRVTAQTAGAALGFIHGNVPGIVEGAHYAGEAFDYFHPEEPNDQPPSSTQKNNSMYGGKFNRPKPYDQSIESKILKQGYMYTTEVHGKATDAYCLYVQHSTWNSAVMARVIAGALLRKVFKKAGHEITDTKGTLPMFSITDGSGFRIEYSSQNPSSKAITTVTYDTVVGSTLDGILTAFAVGFVNQIASYLDNTDVSMPYQMNLYAHDNNGFAVNYRMAATIQIPNEVIHFNCTSILKVQNRTQADLAGAGDLNLERLDNQPLVCTTYSFPAEPKLKNVTPGSTQRYIEGTTTTGLKLYGSASLPGDISFENRPNVAIFANCNKKSNSVLQPGQMKTSYCKYSLKGKIVNVLPKQRLESTDGTIITGVKCATELMVFEEMMRTAGTNPLHLNYEKQLKIGCILTTKKDNFALQSGFLVAELNFPA